MTPDSIDTLAGSGRSPAGGPAGPPPGGAWAAVRRRHWRLLPRAASGRWLTVTGFAILAVLVVCSIVPSLIAPDDPLKMELLQRLKPPSGDHLFGTDEFGRDIFSRVVYGARISLGIAVLVVAVSMLFGCALGAIAGYAGGWADELVMRVTDVFFAFPPILLPMIVVVVLSPGLVNTVIALAVVWWPAYARLMRGQVLAGKQLGYVEAARLLGATPFRILRKHIVPNVAAPLVVMATMDLGFVILSAAGLGFLGLGAQAPTPEWGAMTSAGLPYLLTAWWYPLFPGLAIAVSVLAFNLLGDELQAKLDPRL